jgi:hypothetical protein
MKGTKIMTSKRYQIQQKLKPLYEIRTRIGTQFAKAKEANDTDTIEIWERVWKAVAAEIVALHDEADLMKIAKTEKLKLMKFED